MSDFKLLFSFDGRLNTVTQTAYSKDAAVSAVKQTANNRGEVAVLVKSL